MDDYDASRQKMSSFLCLVCSKKSRVIKSTLHCKECDASAHLRCVFPEDTENWTCDVCTSKRSSSNNRKTDRKSNRQGDGRQPQGRRRLSQSKSSIQSSMSDNLESRVAALPESVTNRFGELCWAQGGSGYSWWPSMIFDPRRTEEPARGEGNRYLGSKYLVYFLECPETPFICLYNRQIKPWFEGFCEDFHMGKAAKACGKQRLIQFQRALLVANHAIDLSPDKRMDIDSLSIVRNPKPKSKRHKPRPPPVQSNNGKDNTETTGIVTRKRGQSAKSGNSSDEIKRETKRSRTTKQESGYESDDSKLVCKIVLKRINEGDRNVGLVLMPSLEKVIFADVRKEIEKDLCGDLLPKEMDWRFYLPQTRLPVSKRQETSLGGFYKILHKESDGRVGTGTFKDPVEIFISEA